MGVFVCFPCCIPEKPTTVRKRLHIDRSMIGYPTDFKHTAHIGAGEMINNNPMPLNHLSTKGGYDHMTTVDVQLDLVDLQIEPEADLAPGVS